MPAEACMSLAPPSPFRRGMPGRGGSPEQRSQLLHQHAACPDPSPRGAVAQQPTAAEVGQRG